MILKQICAGKTQKRQNHENEDVRCIGQGEARHRKCKRLKLGGGQTYGHSSDLPAVVA
jgi:hypothetical protein